MADFSELSLDELKEAFEAKRSEGAELMSAEELSDEQLDTAEALASEAAEMQTEITSREQALAAREQRLAAAREAFAAPPAEEDEGESPSEDEEEDEQEAAVETAAVSKQTATQRLATRKPNRPEVPEKPEPTAPKATIIAAADTGFPAGGEVDLDQVGEALVKKLRGMPKPTGRGEMQKFAIADIRVPFDEKLTVQHEGEAMEVASYAAQESRLEGGSLVAAGGWCAPSEVVYDLCAGESLDGILSLPEISVARGGIRYTKGPQFEDFYGNAFAQTEAQAIAGEEKDCFEIDCPAFEEIRLDAVGLCIKVPILTNHAYPELVRRITSGSIVAFEHWKNARVITQMAALAGAARVVTGLGATVTDSLEALELVADQRRQQWRLPLNQALEVVVPFWVKGAFRSDLARRQGVAEQSITDAQIVSHFSNRNLAVQFVYDWQPLPAGQAYPDTFQAIVYPSGTFVKGVADVISLSAVYDAASLQVNTYTGTFMEQGLFVAEMCYDSDLLTLPICNAGRVGAADLTCTP